MSNEGALELSDAFENCPYYCCKGRLFDTRAKKWIPCPNCSDKLSEFAKGKIKESGKSALELLRLPETYQGLLFNVKDIISETAKKDLKASSLTLVEDSLSDLMHKADMGEVSDYSIMVNLGRKSREHIFIVPYLLRSMTSGLSVVPLLLIDELEEYKARFELNPLDDSSREWGTRYKDFLTAAVCVVTIDAGVTSYGLDAVKGLMQRRSTGNKSTIIFTNAWGNRVRALCSEEGEREKHLATLISVEYEGSFVKTESKYAKKPSSLGISGTSYEDLTRQ